ncbi:AGE family epimerase/isomerase [Virgibacillus dakarensis]|nr:AGE family epimerase/isomerase [Virgibacillus dakarensis]
MDFPNFKVQAFLKQHIVDTVNFYAPRCIDAETGGYINCFLDDGTICDKKTKHLVGQSRFIYIFSIAAMISDSSCYKQMAEWGLKFLQHHQRDPKNGGYYWVLKGLKVEDSSKQAYGHAFVLIAAATAYKAGISYAGGIIAEVYDILERHFWREQDGLYVDEISRDWQTVSSYRGQNANMHLCEAMLTAYEATGEARYLQRAYRIAYSVIFKLLPQSGYLIWEHYDEDWKIDWNYNKGNTKDEFRPYGYIFGHSIEWSKLLQRLEKHLYEPWMFPHAKMLFDQAVRKGIDYKNGGIFYSMAPAGEIIDSDKVYWVIAEAIGASALFAAKTDDPTYWEFYDQIFAYSWEFLIDQKRGGWYQMLNRNNQKYSNIKSPPPKTDYHPVTNCVTALRAFYDSDGVNKQA